MSLLYSSSVLNLNSHDWLQIHLSSRRWTFESVKLLISRQGSNRFPIQNLEACLHWIIQGSEFCSPVNLEEVLVLLIRAGADVLQRHPHHGTVSDLASSAKACYIYGDSGSEHNGDFALRELWSRALTRSGFDAEKVIETSLRLPRSPFALKSREEGRSGAIAPGVFYKIPSKYEESETEDENYEDASEEGKRETMYDSSEEDSEEDDEMDDFSDDQSASSGAQMELDPRETNSFSLSSEDRMLLEQDAKVWTE